MSEQIVARWNAIPSKSPTTNLKRQRSEEESDHDDDMSWVSHSPSPTSQNDMDVDEGSIQKPTREVVTVDTKIKPSNKGFALLTKLGWHEGQPVGLSAEGRTDPVPFYVKSDLTGLGKANLDFQMIDTTVSQRREFDSERQRRETGEQRKVREDSVVRKSTLEAEISSTLKPFFCELCDKQFKTVAEYDEHTNSYAHPRKARFKNLQANIRKKPQELDKRKEKRKMAAANGIKIPKAQTPALSHIPATDLSNDAPPTEIHGSGPIVTVSPATVPSSSSMPPSGFKTSGWTISAAAISTSNLSPNPAPAPKSELHFVTQVGLPWKPDSNTP